MEYFPSVNDYDLDTTAGKALYLARCDLDPVCLLIEHTSIALNGSIGACSELILDADANNNFFESSKYANIQGIMATRVSPLAYQSVLLMVVSLMEEAFKCWCRMINDNCPTSNSFDSYKAKKNGELEKCFGYIELNTNVVDIENHQLMGNIYAIRAARNSIVHNGGRVKDSKIALLQKYNIGIRDEDHSVYLDYETLKDIYDKIIQFIDDVFNQGIISERNTV